MALTFTEGAIFYGTIPASPPEDFIAALDAILTSVGWTNLAVYEDTGYEYLLQSNQNLAARCRIWFPDNPAYPNCLALQCTSAVDLDLEGHIHHFAAGHDGIFDGDPRDFSQYVVWANNCQLFIGAVHPDSWGEFPRAVQCGIPYAHGAVEGSPQCRAETPPPEEATNELWWSSGDDFGIYAGPSAVNFRNSYFCQRYSFCHNLEVVNAVITSGSIAAETPALQLGIVRSAINWKVGSNDWPAGFIWNDNSPLANSPLLIHNATIYGQLWDAVLVSQPMALEEPETIFDSGTGTTTNWHNYMRSHPVQVSTFTARDEGKCACLLLLEEFEETEGEVGNVAY